MALSYSAPAKAEIDISALGGQSTMAEQGAICASFAALMQNQQLINEDLGFLWSERRKFSGAVIRRAVELSGMASPQTDDIDLLINDYRDWLILNLSTQDSNVSSADYQSDVQNMIKTNCKSLFVQADKAIVKRFPELSYLIDKTALKQAAGDNKQQQALIAKNNELNLKLIALRAEMATLKAKAVAQATAKPKPRPQAPKAAIVTAKVAEVTEVAEVADKAKPTPKAQPSSDAPAADRYFFAQLGSFSSEALAADAIASLTANYLSLFQDISLEIQPHLFASGKTFYRVKTPPGERPTITDICNKLWDARMGCLIKTTID